jgi:hypothetical protein
LFFDFASPAGARAAGTKAVDPRAPCAREEPSLALLETGFWASTSYAMDCLKQSMLAKNVSLVFSVEKKASLRRLRLIIW